MDTDPAAHDGTVPSERPTRSSGRRRWVPVVAAWAAVLALWFWYRHRLGTGNAETLQRLIDTARGNRWAVAAYILISVARPFVLFPATLVTVAGGMLFGAAPGVVIASGAANLSALIGHGLGRDKDQTWEVAQYLASLPSGGTACVAPLRHLNRAGKNGDLVVFVSDNQSWADFRLGGPATRGTPMAEEWERFRARNPRAPPPAVRQWPSPGGHWRPY